MEPHQDSDWPDPYIQPSAEYAEGLSRAECLEFCNEHKAGCCSTEDGRLEVKDGNLELMEAPWACAAYDFSAGTFPACLPACLPICLSVCLYVCLTLALSIRLSAGELKCCHSTFLGTLDR
jgi:hypothetical protein